MSGGLVPFEDPTDLTPALREAAISTYLENAKAWLTTAVEQTGPHQIASAKAEIATTAEATRQLGLSRDIQQDALEMVRRAEFALGKAIRKGQVDGTVRARGYGGAMPDHVRLGKPVRGSRRGDGGQAVTISPTELVSGASELTDIYALSDGADLEQFEAGLAEAKAEGDVTRANVARKVRARTRTNSDSRDHRAAVITTLAGRGFSSPQIAAEVGVAAGTVRLIARDYSIEIPADKIVGKTRRIDYTASVESAVTELDNWSSSLSIIDFTEVDLTGADEWIASLTESAKELRRFIDQIRKASNV